MATKKATKTHTSSRKKASATSSTKRRTKKASATSSTKARGKKASAKSSKRTAKDPLELKISEAEWLKLRKRTLKMFQMVYDDYQNGKFHRIF